MKYGLPYKVVEFSKESMKIVDSVTEKQRLKWEQGVLNDKTDKSPRKSQIAWINDRKLSNLLAEMANAINTRSGWNLKLETVEPVQYGMYRSDDYYNWHVDQHKQPNRGSVRKISMSLFLSNDYEGGEFDLDIYKPETDPRYESFKLPIGSAIFFQSDVWHRVRPVKSGVRKSIVAWFSGPAYV